MKQNLFVQFSYKLSIPIKVAYHNVHYPIFSLVSLVGSVHLKCCRFPQKALNLMMLIDLLPALFSNSLKVFNSI